MIEDYSNEEQVPLDSIILSYAYSGGERYINTHRLIQRHNIGGYDAEFDEIFRIITDNSEAIEHALGNVGNDYDVDISEQYISFKIPESVYYGYVTISDIMRQLRSVEDDDDLEIIINNETIIAAIAFNGGKENFDSVKFESLEYFFDVNELNDIIDELVISVKKNPDLITELHSAFINANEKRLLSMLTPMKSQTKSNMMRNLTR
jgi:hypothetical protein